MEHTEPSNVEAHLISSAVARAIYQRGLALGPGQWNEFPVSTDRGEQIVLVVGNGRDGLVDVICPNSRLGAQLGTFVGFRILSSPAP